MQLDHPLLGELLGAVLALILLQELVVRRSLVRAHQPLALELAVTQVAGVLVRLLGAVCVALVLLDAPLFGELLAAHLALEALELAVAHQVHAHMLIEVRLDDELLAADLAHVVLHADFDHDVLAQRPFDAELLATHIALVRLLVRVQLHVTRHCAFVNALAAHRTHAALTRLFGGARLLLHVHVVFLLEVRIQQRFHQEYLVAQVAPVLDANVGAVMIVTGLGLEFLVAHATLNGRRGHLGRVLALVYLQLNLRLERTITHLAR